MNLAVERGLVERRLVEPRLSGRRRQRKTT
jgi:hypothetical protein